MFRRKNTITGPDRDRLIEVTRGKANALSWAMFIDRLKRQLKHARVVEPHRVSRDVVTMYSKVRLVDRKSNQREVYTLVYPDEADLAAGNLSVLSALGTALLGARVGETITVDGAAGPRAIKIEDILYQPEAEARYESQLSGLGGGGNCACGAL